MGQAFATADDSLTAPYGHRLAGSDGQDAPVVAVRRPASRARLTLGLVFWDALVPAALLTFAARFERLIGAGTTGGAEPDSDKLALVLALVSPVCLAVAGAYQHRRRRAGSRLHFGMRLLVVAIVTTWIAIVLGAGLGWPIDYSQMLGVTLLLPAAWLLGRWACDRHPVTGAAERVLLIGSGLVAGRVAALAARDDRRRLIIVGRLGDDPADDGVPGVPTLGGIADLARVLSEARVDRVIVGFVPGRDSALLEALRTCGARGVQADVVPRFFDLVGPEPRAHSLGNLALVEIPARGLTHGQRALKRSMDAIGAAVLLVAVAPALLALTADAYSHAIPEGRRPI